LKQFKNREKEGKGEIQWKTGPSDFPLSLKHLEILFKEKR